MAEQEEELMWPGGFPEAKSVQDFDFIMSGKNGGPITKIPKSRLAEVVGVVGESMPAIQGGATAATAVTLPAGPVGQNRWFDASWGYWKYNNVVLKNPTGTDGIPEGNDGQLYWSGATTEIWSIPKMQALPKGKDGKTTEPFNVAKAGGYPTGDTVYFGENKIYKALVNVPMGESPLTHPAKWKLELNGSTNPGSGTYIKAYEMSFVKNEYFQWWLIDEVNGVSFKKLIFHQGNQVFIDSFGAVVQLDIDPAYFYNFKFTVKLTSANQEIFVPVSTQASNYDMLIDWGDGIKSTFRGTGNFKSCKHTYTGIVGSEFQISISGTCPRLSFGNINAFDRQTLISIDNNTLQDTMLMISFDNCINLKRICANALSNHSPDAPINLNFTGCTNFEEVESGFGEYLQGKNVTGVTFGNTSLNSLDDSFFKYIDGLTTCANMFVGTSISKVPTTLRRSLTNISSIFYMFSGIKVPINIPSNLFDLVSGGKITDARNAFAGTSVTPIQVTGDAKALYDVLLIKSAQGVLSGGCFSYNQMTNKNQVPTAWGGTLV